ncbi:MAG: hypothetical protein WA579_09790, partial [Rhodomicrobium sp.]
GWPGLTRPSSHNLKDLVFFWMAASKGGHDDGIGGNIRVIKSRKGEGLIWDRNTWSAYLYAIPARASLGRDDDLQSEERRLPIGS